MLARRGKRIVIGIAILIAAFVVALPVVESEMLKRHHAFAGYADAVAEYVVRHGYYPATLENLENEYNNSETAKVRLPTEPWYLRPSYRPSVPNSREEHLVLIENRPQSSWLPLTYGVWSKGDGPMRVEFIWNWRLREIVREDDDKRKRGTASSGM